LPLVIFGAFGINVSSFSSRIHEATTFEDSLPCSGVSKRVAHDQPLQARNEAAAALGAIVACTVGNSAGR
jgi:hypothetical protein